MYARGQSNVTDNVIDDVRVWQFRPYSLKYVSWKDRKAVTADLRKIYTSATVDEAKLSLEAFAEKWDQQYLTISQSWISH